MEEFGRLKWDFLKSFPGLPGRIPDEPVFRQVCIALSDPPGSMDMGKMMGNFPILPELCANSKRKRIPVLWHFRSSA
jgi:hypothetical protein